MVCNHAGVAMVGHVLGNVPMFEAVITACLIADAEVCRDMLIPGHRASARSVCEASLSGAGTVALPDGLIPANPARCQAEGPALKVVEVGSGVFLHRGLIQEPNLLNKGDVSNLGFVVGQRSVAVIDTGTARWMGEAMVRTIRQTTDLPISHVILTHMHPDHVLGATALAETGAKIVGHTKLPRALADRRENYLESLSILVGRGAFIGSDIVVPSVLVADQVDVDLGGRVLSVQAWPTAHSGTDLTVQDDQTGLVFSGDLVFHDHTPALDGSLRGWQRVLTDLGGLDPTGILPGHGGPVLDWPDGVEDMHRYLDVLAHDTTQAIDDGVTLGAAVEVIAESERDHWTLFDAYNPRNATVAYTELEWE